MIIKQKSLATLVLAAFSSLLLIPAPVFAQSILGSASDYGVLSGATVTSALVIPGVVISNGDVGAPSLAAITGFPPAQIINGVQVGGVGQAILDLITARATLNNMVVPLGNDFTATPNLGGRTLAAGVYNFDVAADLTGTLTLDAGGKNNVTWVINIGTSLTTAANAQVVFINLGSNGGKDNGLFWNAGAAITFGATNIIAGNYLAGTHIDFGTTVPATGSGSGRALAVTDYIAFDGSATMDVLGTGGDLTGGLDAGGNQSGYVLLSGDGTYSQGVSSLVLSPGHLYNTPGVTVDGNSADALLVPASLTVFGTVATLTGTNTYTGGTFVDGAQVASPSTPSSLTTASGNLPLNGNVSLIDSNNTGAFGNLIFDQATTGTYGGIISTDPMLFTVGVSTGGSVTKTGVGTLTITNANTYAGGTFITGGTLAFSGLGTLGDTTGSLAVNGGILDLGTTSQTVGAVTIAGGTISNGTLTGASYTSTGGSVDAILAGTDVVFTNTSGTTTLTGANTYTGGTVINGGSLVVNTASLPMDRDVTVSDPGMLVFDQAATGTFGGVISGNGSVTKQGSGALTVTNTNTYTGDTFLNAGTMILNAGQIGKTTVASGAFLRGNGSVNGDLSNNGTVSPGFSPGTILVVGNYSQGPGGTLVMEIASPISYDQLVVGGTTSLDGTLQVDLLGGYNPAGQSFDIITSTGAVSGTFSVVTGAALASDVTYGSNTVTVSFTQTAFNTFAGTPNQVAIANAAQTNPALTAALNLVPLAADLPGALNALSPQGYEIWSDIAFARAVSLTHRLSNIQGATPGHDYYYFQAGQSRSKSSGDKDVRYTDFNSDSGLVGGDHAISDTLTIGAFLEYTETDAGLGSFGSKTEAKSIMPGLRAAWNRDAWFANAVLAYGFDSYKSTRQINFPGTSATARSKTDGRQWIADLTAGRHFDTGIVSVSPFAGLLASGWKADGFTETGAGAFNATVRDQSAHSLRTQLGVEAALNLTAGSVGLRPHVRATWLHELTNDSRPISGSFSGSNFSIQTRQADRDTLRLGAGLEAMLTPTLSLYLDYAVQTGNTTRVTGEWTGGLSMRF